MLAQSTQVGVHMHLHMRIRIERSDMEPLRLGVAEIKSPRGLEARGRSALAL